jgi:alpha-1,2-mannosyltransferase
VAWNIIKYNVFSNNATLYGTEPWHYYLLSGLLNFNLVFLLALASAPVLAATHIWDRASSLPSRTTRTGLLMLRISPFYLWLAVLSKQPHKEERFLFPACSLTCFCAALSFSMLRNLVQRLYLKVTGSPEKVRDLASDLPS